MRRNRVKERHAEDVIKEEIYREKEGKGGEREGSH